MNEQAPANFEIESNVNYAGSTRVAVLYHGRHLFTLSAGDAEALAYALLEAARKTNHGIDAQI